MTGWGNRRSIWIAVVTAMITATIVVVMENFGAPEKQLTSSVAHTAGTKDVQFRREMAVMLGPDIVGGNRITDLENGAEIFPAVLDAIGKARQSITFETYIYWSGSIGAKVAAALAARAQAGVAVNVLVDWAGSIKMDVSLLESMKRAGVVLHRYRPLRWYNLDRMNNRTHRKLLVVDGRLAFTGGVGIADQWQGNAEDPEHWRDVHFRIEGPVVAQVQAAFNDNWIKATGVLLNGPDYFPQLEDVGTSAAHLFVSSPAGGSESMHLMYLMAIAAASERIDLEAAYFVPDPLITSALLAARGRGVRVRVILPGPHIDSKSVRLASKRQWGNLLQAGVEFYEYQPTMLHNKLLIIDSILVSVGSTNFDNRSFRLNDEASLNVYDENFAQHMTDVFEKDLATSQPYSYSDWKDRSLGEKFSERVLLPIKSQL